MGLIYYYNSFVKAFRGRQRFTPFLKGDDGVMAVNVNPQVIKGLVV